MLLYAPFLEKYAPLCSFSGKNMLVFYCFKKFLAWDPCDNNLIGMRHHDVHISALHAMSNFYPFAMTSGRSGHDMVKFNDDL